MSERVFLAQVFAVARRILGHQNQFLHAFFGELMCLSDDRAKAPAAKMSAHLWNEAESTWAVTAFSNLDEGIVTRRSEHARGRLIVEVSRALIAERKHRQRPRVRPGIANA